MRVVIKEYKGPGGEILDLLNVLVFPDRANNVGRMADVRGADNRKPRSWQIMCAIGETETFNSTEMLYMVRNVHTGQWTIAFLSELGNLY